MMARTVQKIIEDANSLARLFYRSMGYQVPKGYRFDQASHPQEIGCWNQAVMAYDFIEGTDVENALSELDDEQEGPHDGA